MRRFLKILKWTGIILLLIISGLFVTVMARQNLKFDAPLPQIKASTDTNVIKRGKELIFGPAHCADCHSKVNADSLMALGQEVPLSGGYLFDLGIAKIYTKNITPDSTTGIGKYTDPEIARALRYGVGPDRRALFDFMPFHNTSDEDLTAIISYLRAQKPVKNEIPASSYSMMGKVVKAFFIKPVGPDGEVPKSIKRDSTIEYGKYLATSVANCNGCHTKRDMMTGAFTGELFAGGLEIEGLITPNLTPDPATGRITNWSQQDFINRFHKGKLILQSPMPWKSFNRMSDQDLVAIYKYLKSLKPLKMGQMKEEKK
jgi:mono/diheme cytochrome c family protein